MISADRGLCGGFNGAITRQTRNEVARLRGEGKTVKLLMVGRKSADALRRELGDAYIESLEGIQGTSVAFGDAASIGDTVRTGFEAGEFDVCTVIFNKFKSAISQEVTLKKLIPAEVDETAPADDRVSPMNMSRMRKNCWRRCCRSTSRPRSTAPCLNPRLPNSQPDDGDGQRNPQRAT